MISEYRFSDMGPKIRFLCYQMAFSNRTFSDIFFIAPLCEKISFFEQDAHIRKRLLEKGLNFQRISSCSGDGRGGSISTPRKQRIKCTNQLTLVLGLLSEEDAVVSRENICM